MRASCLRLARGLGPLRVQCSLSKVALWFREARQRHVSSDDPPPCTGNPTHASPIASAAFKPEPRTCHP
eukprot:3173702-Rhodomonas_salina.3